MIADIFQQELIKSDKALEKLYKEVLMETLKQQAIALKAANQAARIQMAKMKGGKEEKKFSRETF